MEILSQHPISARPRHPRTKRYSFLNPSRDHTCFLMSASFVLDQLFLIRSILAP